MDIANDIEWIALDLIERFGEFAPLVARELAEVSDWSVCFMLCAPFSRPLVLVWPLTDCSKRCRMQCGYKSADDEGTELKTIERFGSDASHISCKLIEIVERHQQNPHSAQTWCDIADAIERILIKA